MTGAAEGYHAKLDFMAINTDCQPQSVPEPVPRDSTVLRELLLLLSAHVLQEHLGAEKAWRTAVVPVFAKQAFTVQVVQLQVNGLLQLIISLFTLKNTNIRCSQRRRSGAHTTGNHISKTTQISLLLAASLEAYMGLKMVSTITIRKM